jgi:hypothetical protein
MQRRTFLQTTSYLSALLVGGIPLSGMSAGQKQRHGFDVMAPSDEQTLLIFMAMVNKAQKEQWVQLPIGERMVRFAKEMLNTPYVSATLEGEPEICRAVLTGLDCVTLFESALCFARILKKGTTTYNDFVNEITYTRYRDGRLTDYVSRLHYTTEWIENNVKKRVVRNITQEIGGSSMALQLGIMSNNPKFYPALQQHPEYITRIGAIEQELNKGSYFIIPKAQISAIEPLLKTGDIIAIATNKKGIDYAHTGLIAVSADGKPHFLHASQTKKKVILDDTMAEYMNSVSTHTGIAVTRPIEVSL